MDMDKPVNIKKRVTSGLTAAQRGRQPATLALGEHDGQLWASNRYWVTPAPRVAPLLEQYNLDPAVPGAFEVNGTVRKVGDQGPDVGRLLSMGDYPEKAAPLKVAGHDAHVRLSDRSPWLAVYQVADGTVMGLPADDLAWLSNVYGTVCGHPEEFGLAPDEYLTDVRVMTKGTGGKPVLLVADRMRTVRHSSYGTDPETKELVHHPAVIENLGPKVIGALMAVKLGG
jgi:hypothetical protein